jgi:ABC-type lipoprotein export system ATPase subunit
MVGLPDIGHLPFGYLSTGQKRRVAIARMLASYRPVWLVDEPTAGLDKASEKGFAELMQAASGRWRHDRRGHPSATRPARYRHARVEGHGDRILSAISAFTKR